MELKAKWMGIPWNWTEEMDSTNEWAKRDAKNGAPSGAVYIADKAESEEDGRRQREAVLRCLFYCALILKQNMHRC